MAAVSLVAPVRLALLGDTQLLSSFSVSRHIARAPPQMLLPAAVPDSLTMGPAAYGSGRKYKPVTIATEMISTYSRCHM